MVHQDNFTTDIVDMRDLIFALIIYTLYGSTCRVKLMLSSIRFIFCVWSLSVLVNNRSCFICIHYITVKPVLSAHLKRRPKLVFNTDYCLMHVKSIAECFLTFIKLPFVLTTYVSSTFECPL